MLFSVRYLYLPVNRVSVTNDVTIMAETAQDARNTFHDTHPATLMGSYSILSITEDTTWGH